VRYFLAFLRPLFLLTDRIRAIGLRLWRTPEHLRAGQLGEDMAHRFAESRLGWQVIARNYESSIQQAELDLIAIERGTLIVAEIKTRRGDEQSHPLRAIDPEKQFHIGLAARNWVRKATSIGMSVRFDAITVILADPVRIEHHRDVFQPGYLQRSAAQL
jgi:putative endonuclease